MIHLIEFQIVLKGKKKKRKEKERKNDIKLCLTNVKKLCNGVWLKYIVCKKKKKQSNSKIDRIIIIVNSKNLFIQ